MRWITPRPILLGFWPAWYLINADDFIRYKHFGEGAYGETEKKGQELLAERDRVYQ